MAASPPAGRGPWPASASRCRGPNNPRSRSMPPERAVWQRFMADAQARVEQESPLEVRGTLTRLAGLVLEATGIRAPVGSQCLVRLGAQPAVLAEVVGFSNDRAFLMPA